MSDAKFQPAFSPGTKRTHDGEPVQHDATPAILPTSSAQRSQSPAPSTASSSLTELSNTTGITHKPSDGMGSPAKKRKLTFAEAQVEKAVKEREKEEKARHKAEEKAKKEEEKRQKDEEKRKKAEEREAARREKEIEKAEKDAARQAKEAERAERKKAKDAETGQKEAERLKKERVSPEYFPSVLLILMTNRPRCESALSLEDLLQLQRLRLLLTMSLVEGQVGGPQLPRSIWRNLKLSLSLLQL